MNHGEQPRAGTIQPKAQRQSDMAEVSSLAGGVLNQSREIMELATAIHEKLVGGPMKEGRVEKDPPENVCNILQEIAMMQRSTHCNNRTASMLLAQVLNNLQTN